MIPSFVVAKKVNLIYYNFSESGGYNTKLALFVKVFLCLPYLIESLKFQDTHMLYREMVSKCKW